MGGFVESSNSFLCAIKSLSGQILTSSTAPRIADESRVTLNTCPSFMEGRRGPIWSPDGAEYLLCTGGLVSECGLYKGTVYSNDVKFVADLSEYSSSQNASGMLIAPSVKWLDSDHYIFVDRETGTLHKGSLEGDIESLGYFPSGLDPFYYQEREPGPTGEWILIQSGKSGSPQFWGVKSDGTGEVNYSEVFGVTKVYQASWNPTGTLFVFNASTDTGSAVFIININGELIATIKEATSPTWSSDGSLLLLICNKSGNTYDLCLSGSDGRIVSTFSHKEFGRRAEGGFFLSPDNKYIAFKTCFLSSEDNKDHCSLNLLDVQGGSFAEIVSYATKGSYSYPIWSPDSQWLIAFGADSVDSQKPGQFAGYLADKDSMLVCDLIGNCASVSFDDFIAFWAEWWVPPQNWP